VLAIAMLAVSMRQGPAAAGGMDSAHAQERLHCESHALAGDTRDIECPLYASGTNQRFGFKTNFSGGHDDTTASMTATLNGLPLACEDGSKTSLMSEDGDVSLKCKFSVTEKAGTQLVLKVKVSWRHAQYTDFEFYSE
jgi:hypothetical protein